MKKIVAQRLIGMLLLSCVQTTCPRPIKIVAYKAKSGNTGGTFFPASGRSMILIGQDVASRNSLNVSAAEFTTTTAASNTTFNNPSDLTAKDKELKSSLFFNDVNNTVKVKFISDAKQPNLNYHEQEFNTTELPEGSQLRIVYKGRKKDTQGDRYTYLIEVDRTNVKAGTTTRAPAAPATAGLYPDNDSIKPKTVRMNVLKTSGTTTPWLIRTAKTNDPKKRGSKDIFDTLKDVTDKSKMRKLRVPTNKIFYIAVERDNRPSDSATISGPFKSSVGTTPALKSSSTITLDGQGKVTEITQ